MFKKNSHRSERRNQIGKPQQLRALGV